MALPHSSKTKRLGNYALYLAKAEMLPAKATGVLEPVGAPEDEIEVTPAMIEAGVKAYSGFNEDYESRADLVERLFVAMLQRASTEPLSD